LLHHALKRRWAGLMQRANRRSEFLCDPAPGPDCKTAISDGQTKKAERNHGRYAWVRTERGL